MCRKEGELDRFTDGECGAASGDVAFLCDCAHIFNDVYK